MNQPELTFPPSAGPVVEEHPRRNHGHLETMADLEVGPYRGRGRPPLSAKERFSKYYVIAPSGCWMWTGSTSNGYGDISWGSQFGKHGRTKAHRMSYILFKGYLPFDKQVCHTCDTPLCVNPDHLFQGTGQDNMDDCVAKGRTCRGVRCHSAVLDPDKVRDIRNSYAAGEAPKSLSSRYGIATASLWKVLRRKSWKHVI